MSKYYKAETQQGHSKSFYYYIKKLSEVASKQEEAALIENNLHALKEEFKSGKYDSDSLFDGSRLYRDTSQDVEGGSADMASSERHKKEAVVRLLHAEMTGCGQQMLSAFTIHAVNLISSAYLLNKKTGYTAVRILVDPEDALYYLTVACVQKDLKSDNYLEVAAALDFVRQALRPELLEVVSSDVQLLLHYQGGRGNTGGGIGTNNGGHPRAMVRKKVIEAMHAIYARRHFQVRQSDDGAAADASTGSPEDASVGFTLQDFRQALCDQDPAVMDAALRFFSAYVSFHQSQFNALYSAGTQSPGADLALRCLQSQADLVPSFLNILRQVIERRLPNSYDYHHTPSPWMQMRLVSMVSTLTFFSYSYDAQGNSNNNNNNSNNNKNSRMSGIGNKNTGVLLQVVEMLKETMQRADNGMYVGFAIICEIIFATARLLPVMLDYQLDHATAGKSESDALHNSIDTLLVLCSEAVTKFLASKSPNVRLSGIQALCFLSQQQNLYFHYHQKASAAASQNHHDAAGENYFQENYKRLYMPHQMQVMECLNDDVQSDFMTQKCAVTLLFSMSNAENASAIFSRLLLFIQQKRGGRSNPNNKFARNADLLLLDRLVLQTAKGCLTLIKTFARSPMWFVNALNKLMLCVPPDVVSPDTDVQLLLKLLIESELETKDGGLRQECVFLYYVLCGGEIPVAAGVGGADSSSSSSSNDALLYAAAQRVQRRYKKYVSFYTANNAGNSAAAHVPEGMYRIGAWVMGEYGYLLLANHNTDNKSNSGTFYLTREKLLNCLMDMFEKSQNNALRLSDEAKCWLVSSMLKVVAIPPANDHSNDAARRERDLRQEVMELLEPFTRSRSIDLQQRCCEAVRLLQNTANVDPAIVEHVLPPDGNCLPVSADPQLAFLGAPDRAGGGDGFIQTSLRHGARAYDARRREELVRRYAQYTQDGSQLAGGALRGSGGLKTAAYASAGSQRRGAGQNTFVLNTIETGNDISIGMPNGGGAPLQRFSDFADQNYTQQGQHLFGFGESDGRGGGAPNDYAEELVLHAAGAVKRWGVNNLAQDVSYDEVDRVAGGDSAPNRFGGGRDLTMPGAQPPPTGDRGPSIDSHFASADEVDSAGNGMDMKKDKFMSDIFGFSKQKRKKTKPNAQAPARGSNERGASVDNNRNNNNAAVREDLFETQAQKGAGSSSADGKGKKDLMDSLFSDPNATPNTATGTQPKNVERTGPLVVELDSHKIDNIVGGQGPLAKLGNISHFVFTLRSRASATLENVQLHLVTPSVFSVKEMNADERNSFRVIAHNVATSGPDGESFHKTTLQFAQLTLSCAASGRASEAVASVSVTVSVDPESLTQLHVENAAARRPAPQLRATAEISAGNIQTLHTSLSISWTDVLYPVCTKENERILHGEEGARQVEAQLGTDNAFATSNFGKAWGLLARGEASATVRLPYTVSSAKDPLMQRFIKDLLQKLHLGIVEVIDEEVIAAAVLLDNAKPLVKGAHTPSGEYFSTELLLCHFMWDRTLQATVRSRNKDLSLVVLRTMEERLA